MKRLSQQTQPLVICNIKKVHIYLPLFLIFC